MRISFMYLQIIANLFDVRGISVTLDSFAGWLLHTCYIYHITQFSCCNQFIWLIISFVYLRSLYLREPRTDEFKSGRVINRNYARLMNDISDVTNGKLNCKKKAFYISLSFIVIIVSFAWHQVTQTFKLIMTTVNGRYDYCDVGDFFKLAVCFEQTQLTFVTSAWLVDFS